MKTLLTIAVGFGASAALSNRRAEHRGRTHLTEDEKRAMRRSRGSGAKLSQISSKFKVSSMTAARVCKEKG